MTTVVKMHGSRIPWTPGDWNAFFGFGTNILVNMLTLTGVVAFCSEAAGFSRVRTDFAGARFDDVSIDDVLRLARLPPWEKRRA